MMGALILHDMFKLFTGVKLKVVTHAITWEYQDRIHT
jgi:hypothetical protein